MASLKQLVNKIKGLALSNIQVERVIFEFESEIQNQITISEAFYCVCICPVQGGDLTLGENTKIFSLKIFCYAVIQSDRSNILTIVSDAQLILEDLYRVIKEEAEFDEFDITVEGSIEAVENSRIDYLGGASMSISIEAPSGISCEFPYRDQYEG